MFRLLIFIILLNYQILPNEIGLFNYGFNRINENLNFFINADLNFKNQIGEFEIKQEYYGNSYLVNKSINDNQKFSLIWSKSMYDSFKYSLKHQNHYVGNNFNTGTNNNLLNFNVLPGISYKLNDDSHLSLYYGLDRHNQVNVLSNSYAFNSDFNYNFTFDDYQFQTEYENYSTKRTLDRNYKTNDAKLNIIRVGENSNLMFNSYFNSFENDFIRSYEEDLVQIEKRYEQKFNLSLDMSYYLLENLKNDVSVSYLQTGRDNSYNEYNIDNPRSGIIEVRNLDVYNVLTRFTYEINKSFLRFAINYKNELLTNEARNKFDIDSDELNTQQSNIALLDYNNYFTRILIDNKIQLDNKNVLLGDFVFEINRYDTPSENEHRDRDQLVMRYNQKYEHTFSDLFFGGLELEGRFRHLVYLKQENSINNVKERSLKFAPYFKYFNKKLEMSPEFQIFVNFRSYDYEELFQSIRSDVQRSVSFKDSINYKLDYKFRINVSYFYRYRETGLFSWEKFAQSVTEIKNEFYSNSIIYYHSKDNFYGIGVRYYFLDLESQRNLGNLGDDSFYLKSISPVVDISFKIKERTNLAIYGWYEFQDLGNTNRFFPNIRLETIVTL